MNVAREQTFVRIDSATEGEPLNVRKHCFGQGQLTDQPLSPAVVRRLVALCMKPACLFPSVDHRVTVPFDWRAWEDFIEAMARHFARECGWPGIWYEVGNEPNIGEVGGAALAGPPFLGQGAAWPGAFAQRVLTAGLPPDFFSWHYLHAQRRGTRNLRPGGCEPRARPRRPVQRTPDCIGAAPKETQSMSPSANSARPYLENNEPSRRRGWLAPLLAASILAWTVPPATADVRLPSIINHNMVLQQEQSVPIWGWAEPGETVTVRIANAQVTTTAGPDGTWQVHLPPRKTDNTPHELIISGRNTITLTNVLFGEVWLCGGQSNMGYDVGGVAESNELVGVSYPTLRQFFMHITPTNTPKRDCLGNWRPADAQNLRRFCAVGFWFAERVQQELHVPIGLVWTAYGSSSVETWIPRTALTNDPDFAPLFERAQRADMPWLLAEHQVAMSNWLAQAEAARREGRPEPPKPQDPQELYAYILRHAPGNCFDGGIAPLIPFGLRGVLWYQGEHNAPRGYQYRKLLPILIREWRRLWDNPELYFLIVQLPNYGSTSAEPRDSAWAELREAQWLTAQKEKHCGIAVTIDLGEPRNIHPRNKWDVGKRLALVALNRVYGREDVPYSGPVFTGMTSQDGQMVLSFSHTHGGLVAGTNGTAQPLRGFAVAGAAPAADGRPKFYWAEARIAGDTVILSCTNVPHPVAVRYAWDDSPLANLYSKVGLPAAPFRTDDWPGCTVTNR